MALSSLKVLAPAILLLALLSRSDAIRPILSESNSSALSGESNTSVVDTPQFIVDPCRPRDINIQQFESSGVGIPIWKVQITNLCTNVWCMVSEVVVQCGTFHSATLVNPHVFRRLDVNAGTCIVNDGGQIKNAETVSFQYSEIMKQPLNLKSARVTCW